jgi:tetratricopeptide (TPR) repeat protein
MKLKYASFALCLLAALSTPAFARDIVINTSLKNGDRLSGVLEISVTVDAPVSINQVEFYVGDQLRETDRSTPYTMKLDTIAEKEGPLTLVIAAYASDGSSKKVTLNLTVDNQLKKGSAYHLANANTFLNNSKFYDAINAARIALKADEDSIPARITLARAYLGAGILDEAQKWSEDAMVMDENPDTCDLVAAVHMERAFKFVPSSTDKNQLLKQTFDDFSAAIANKHKAMQLRIKAMGPETDANRIKLADLYIANNEFSTAIRILKKAYNEFEPDSAVADRLVFACIRSGRMMEATAISENVQKRSARDAVMWALTSAGYAYYRNYDKAADALKQAILSDSESPSVMTAAAFAAVRKNDSKAIASQITQLLSKNITDPEVYYYLSLLQFWTGDFISSRENFRKAVIQNPLFTDAYLQRGYDALNQALTPAFASDKEYLLQMAYDYMELARLAKPDSAEALNGLALVLLNQDKDKEGLDMAEAASKAGPEYPWAFFTLAAARNKNKDASGAVKMVDVAGKLDEKMLSGRGIPTVYEAWVYTLRQGRLPVVIAPRG